MPAGDVKNPFVKFHLNKCKMSFICSKCDILCYFIINRTFGYILSHIGWTIRPVVSGIRLTLCVNEFDMFLNVNLNCCNSTGQTDTQ